MKFEIPEHIRKLQTPDTLRKLGYTVLDAPRIETVTPKHYSKMTKTEALFVRLWITPRIITHEFDGYVFHGIRVVLKNGHAYTPDFVCFGKRKTIIEVKGSYKLHSYQAARHGFDQARIEWPEFDWRWFELNKKTRTFDEKQNSAPPRVCGCRRLYMLC